MYLEQTVDGDTWAVCYDKARREDGSLLFPERLTDQFLDSQRKTQGSYIYAHQYQNEIIPGDEQDFKKSWLVYYDQIPKLAYTFAFVDPAISLEPGADYTAFVVVDVDVDNVWYLRVAKRMRITATQTIKLIFDLASHYKCKMIGIEVVAYQMALMHFMNDEMRKRKITLPIHGVKRGPDMSKSMRIRSLVPRFEWQRILVRQGLTDFEDEFNKFPRGSYVDILDALSSIEEIAYPPEKPKESDRAPAPNHKDYEKHYIRNLYREREREQRDAGE